MSERKGLTMHVYRTDALGQGADFSLGGVSSRVDKLTITGVVEGGSRPSFRELDARSQVFAPNDGAPEAWLYLRHVGRPVWCVVPAMPQDHPGGLRSWLTRFMFGGNYAGGSDSRLSDEHGVYGALAVHDRCER